MRPPLAAVLGIVLTLGLSFVGQLVTTSLLAAPDGAPLPIGRTFLSATLALTFGAAVIGAFVAAHLASAHRFRVALAVAIATALFGVLSALTAPDEIPLWIAWAMPLVAFLGALGGGAVRAMNRSGRSAV
jgi:hypothetical protein